jgi:hypothetical protein
MSSDDLDLFGEIAAQGFPYNDGHRSNRRGARLGNWSVSPGVHAKVARPSTDSPAATASPPDAVPVQPVQATVPRLVVTSEAQLVQMLRDRRDQVGITNECLDGSAGWADRYGQKLLGSKPVKGFGAFSLELILRALALKIVRVEFTEDPAQVAKLRSRWVKRKRT